MRERSLHCLSLQPLSQQQATATIQPGSGCHRGDLPEPGGHPSLLVAPTEGSDLFPSQAFIRSPAVRACGSGTGQQ